MYVPSLLAVGSQGTGQQAYRPGMGDVVRLALMWCLVKGQGG